MRINDSLLQEVLLEAIAYINKRPKHVEKTLKEIALKMFNITGGEMAYILNGRTPVGIMSEDTLYKTTRVLYEYLKGNSEDFDIQKLDVDKYFFENEQKNYNKKIDRRTIEKDIVCDSWLQVASDEFVVGLSNKKILELVSANRIQYNPETQRNLTEIETEYGIIKKVTIDGNAIDSIGDDMDNGDYIPNAIAFNINPDLYPQPKIVNGKFIIPKESVIDCINGYHRLKASVTRTKLNPKLDFNFIVIITGFDVKKAKKFIIQENYRVPLSDEQVTQDDQGDAANYIIEKLNQSLYFKNSDIPDISYQLNKIINSIFKPKRLKSAEEIQNALNIFKTIEFSMNKLIEDNGLIGKVFSKEEWFIYLFIINYCNEMNRDFIEIISKIKLEDLLGEISITNEPMKKHFKLMNEVVKNV